MQDEMQPIGAKRDVASCILPAQYSNVLKSLWWLLLSNATSNKCCYFSGEMGDFSVILATRPSAVTFHNDQQLLPWDSTISATPTVGESYVTGEHSRGVMWCDPIDLKTLDQLRESCLVWRAWWSDDFQSKFSFRHWLGTSGWGPEIEAGRDLQDKTWVEFKAPELTGKTISSTNLQAGWPFHTGCHHVSSFKANVLKSAVLVIAWIEFIVLNHTRLCVGSATCVIYFVTAPLTEWEFIQIF